MTEEPKNETPEDLQLSPVAERLRKLGLPVVEVPPDEKVRIRIKIRPPAPLKQPPKSD